MEEIKEQEVEEAKTKFEANLKTLKLKKGEAPPEFNPTEVYYLYILRLS
jgi:hypothetical protein